MATASGPAVELRDLTKAFGSLVANDRVTISVERGTIHGIVGENGAGKSTAMKMLYGLYEPDSGEIRVNGIARKWASPRDAIAAGVGMVHQHFMLAGPYTALDNILLGAEPGVWDRCILPRFLRPIGRLRARKELDALSKRYGLSVPLDAPIESLPVGVQQRIEILKLLYRSAEILILDEPTAVLTPQETTELFENLRKLKAENKTILIITHKLKEIMSFTDRVSVFRAGKVTGELETRRTNPQELADLMVGRAVKLRIDVSPPTSVGANVLETRGLTLGAAEGGKPKLDEVSFAIRAGEIVGIAGVEGNGQSELLQALLHPAEKECRSSGAVILFDEDVSELKTAEIRNRGIGVIPEDRHREGLLLDRNLPENFLLGLQRSGRFSVQGWIDSKRLVSATARAMEKYDVRPRALDTEAGRLSGGNQQKLIIGREFETEPRVLISAQPTRGVDVGAIELIHRRIVRARDEGAGVLLVSSELDEVLTLSDRILVMYEGRIVGEFKRGAADEREIGLLMGGGRSKESA